MKILMISEFFPPVMGGLERHVAGLCKGLTERGHEVRVLTLGWKGLNLHERQDGFEIFRLSGFFQNLGFIYGNKQRRFHPPMPDYLLVEKIKKTIKLFKPDIIHCHGWIIYSVLQAKKHFDVPLVVTLHDYGLFCPKRTMTKDGGICRTPFTTACISCSETDQGPYKSRATSWAINANKNKLDLVNKFIAVSSFVKQEYQRHLNIEDDRICIIPNFYSVSENNVQIPANEMLPNDFILFVGTFSISKGVDILVKAYQQIKTDVKLFLIGIKQVDFNCQSDERIIILENQPHDMVMEAWRRCHFGVVPSIWPDPCPTVALEAMAGGKAVVGSDIGGLKDIVVHGETGLLVPPGDEGALAKVIKTLISNPHLAGKMGEKGRRRLLEHFSLGKVMGEIQDLYKQAKEQALI